MAENELYKEELRTLLSNNVTRRFLARLICDDCKVFSEDAPMNASAYALQAVQQVGKRLLNDCMALDFEAAMKAIGEFRNRHQSEAVDDDDADPTVGSR